MERRRFAQEFKLEAVRLSRDLVRVRQEPQKSPGPPNRLFVLMKPGLETIGIIMVVGCGKSRIFQVSGSRCATASKLSENMFHEEQWTLPRTPSGRLLVRHRLPFTPNRQRIVSARIPRMTH